MTIDQKIKVGILTLLVWIGCIVAKIGFPLAAADLNVLLATAQGTLAGLGITHLVTSSQSKDDKVLP